MDYLDEDEELFVTVKDSVQEVVIPQFPGRKVLVVSFIRVAFALLFFVTEYKHQENCLEVYRILQLGYYHGFMTLIGAMFGIFAGHRRTAPSLMAAQLFGVCLLALCSIALGFMIFCQIVDAENITADTQFGHETLMVIQCIFAISDFLAAIWVLLTCNKSLNKYLGSYEAKEEVHQQFHKLYDHDKSSKHDHREHRYFDDGHGSHSRSPSFSPSSIASTDFPKLKVRRATEDHGAGRGEGRERGEGAGNDGIARDEDFNFDSSGEGERIDAIVAVGSGLERRGENGDCEKDRVPRESIGSSVFSQHGNDNIKLKERRPSPAIAIGTKTIQHSENSYPYSHIDYTSTGSESGGNSIGKSRYFSVHSMFFESENASPESGIERQESEKKRRVTILEPESISASLPPASIAGTQRNGRGHDVYVNNEIRDSGDVMQAIGGDVGTAIGQRQRRKRWSQTQTTSSDFYESPTRWSPPKHQEQQQRHRQPYQPSKQQKSKQQYLLDAGQLHLEEMRRANAAAAVI